MTRIAPLVLVVAACGAELGDDAHVLDDQAEMEAAGDGKADGELGGETFQLVVEHAAVVGTVDRPNVVVYMPRGYDPGHPTLVVYLHGWNNCATNVLRSTGRACTSGGPVRSGYRLAAQLEETGKNALLVVPELAFDRPTGDPGDLIEPGTFAAMIDDTLAQLGATGELEQILVASHSGGYRAAAAIVSAGGLPIDELWLLDSLYGHRDEFDAFARDPDVRFADVYTADGGTRADSEAMATELAGEVDAAELLDDRTTRTLADEELAHRLLFKRSAMTHDSVPRYYFGRLLATSGVLDKPW